MNRKGPSSFLEEALKWGRLKLKRSGQSENDLRLLPQLRPSPPAQHTALSHGPPAQPQPLSACPPGPGPATKAHAL